MAKLGALCGTVCLELKASLTGFQAPASCFARSADLLLVCFSPWVRRIGGFQLLSCGCWALKTLGDLFVHLLSCSSSTQKSTNSNWGHNVVRQLMACPFAQSPGGDFAKGEGPVQK